MRTTEIEENDQWRFFKVPSRDLVVAQPKAGGQVKQKTVKPKAYDYRKRKISGPWNKNKTFRTLEAVEGYYAQPEFTVLRTEVVYVKFKDDVYEYRLVEGRVQSRVLSSPP
ncbi:MAG: hypothetical protein GF414_00660 [Candidatus Altiarchaeales archaeon]|nr:hypothetical protein [Candidatus Altiarchaeales archaeon]